MVDSRFQHERNRVMQLFASMGGAPLPLEGAILVGGIYLILPLFFILGGLALLLDSHRCAKMVLWLASPPLLILVPMVACYEPAIGELDQAAQTGGWMSLWLYGIMTLGSLVLLRISRSPNVGGPAAQ